MEVKIGHILKKNKENIQKTGYSEKEDMKWKWKLDIYWRKIRKISKRQGARRRKTWNGSENWTYIEERKGKYPKDRTLGEGRHEMERKVGYKMRKRGENVQNAA